jgi:hypothetical protein
VLALFYFSCNIKSLTKQHPKDIPMNAAAPRITRRTFSAATMAMPAPAQVDKFAEFAEEHPAVAAWIEARRAGFAFAQSLRESVQRYGSLTDGQMTAATRLMARDAEAAALKAARVAQGLPAIEPGKEVTVKKIEQAFTAAKQDGIVRPKLRLDAFLFKPAPEGSKNAGGIYVLEGEAYLGKVIAGRFNRSRDCTEDQEARIIAAASDPLAAAVAYGQRTGCCSVCNLPLTNSESIELGIGPICRKRMGWF